MKKSTKKPMTPEERNFVAKYAKRSGAGAHKDKQGSTAPRNRQKREWKKDMAESHSIAGSLIQSIVKTTMPIDPVDLALEEILTNEAMSKTYLDDGQIERLADYVNELLTTYKAPSAIDAAYLALEDVAAFETATHPILKSTAKRIVNAYLKKFK